NGDMYVDGHKAASDVRDEFVSVTEKLMDELAQCYNVLPQLDINNTIDHRPEGDEKWFLENEKTVTQFCRKLRSEERFSRNAETDLVCRLLLEKKKRSGREGQTPSRSQTSKAGRQRRLRTSCMPPTIDPHLDAPCTAAVD